LPETKQELGTCIPPKSVIGKTTSEIADMFGSHDWVVDDSKDFGREGLLIHYHCSRCSAKSYATITEEDDEEERARTVSA
jgi:hypothetical protein